MYIGIISDTHCWFDNPLKKFLEPVDEIWHAGDFGNEETLLQIADFKPLKGVYGNCDGTQVRGRVPYTQFFECGGKRVLMTTPICPTSSSAATPTSSKSSSTRNTTCSPSIQVPPAFRASIR